MNFFERQEEARRSTRKLVVLFVLAVFLIVMAVYLAVALALTWAEDTVSVDPWNLTVLGWVAAFTLTVIVVGSLYKIAALRSGGQAVGRLLGGRPLQPNTRDFKERRLLNVVEEMALASGLAVPTVYVLDQEKGINAFAAGFGPGDTVIGVTRGCLDLLSRDELQGVIGHEMSHIVNGDAAFNLQLIGVLAGLTFVGAAGEYLLRAGSKI